MFKKLLLLAVLPVMLIACKDQEKKTAVPAQEQVKAGEASQPQSTPTPVIDPNSPPPPRKANTIERKKAFTAMYDCQGANFRADFDGKGNVEVLVTGKNNKLSLVKPEAGARYETAEGADPYVILWDMDKEAIIEVDGREWMKCTQMQAE